MLDKAGIYCITCVATGEFYIGSTVNLQKRYRQHKSHLHNQSHDNRKLQAAWDEHGEEAFEFSVVEVVDQRDQLVVQEQFWMDTLKPALNVFQKAAPSFDMTRSAEANFKSAEALRGQKRTPEQRQRMSEARKGYVPTEEARANMSAGQKRRTDDRSLSDEHKEKLRQVALAQQADPEYRRKHHEGLKAAMNTPEMHEKLSKAHTGKVMTTEHRANIGAANLGSTRTPETRQKQSEARRKWWEKR